LKILSPQDDMIYTLTLNPSIDQYMTVKKLVPNDKLKAEDIRLEPGGKGFNVSRVIRELGGKTKAFGFLGGHTGDMIMERLENISHQFCRINGETRTNLVIRDRTSGLLTRINPPGPRLNAQDIRRLTDMLETAKPRPAYWVLSGSLPPGVPDYIYQKLISVFQKRGERCILDADDRALKLGIKSRPFMIKPNTYELERLIGHPCRTKNEIITAGRRLAESVEIVAITLAKRGAYVITQDGAWHCAAPPVEGKSDVGAGDSFIGGFCTALDRGEDYPSATRWAVAAATSTVKHSGTARCERRDVMQFVNRMTVKAC
jgi:1-phosphofructokinase family hexose kinase